MVADVFFVTQAILPARIVGRLTRSLPLSRPNGLPVYVARVPAAPFCETPTWVSKADVISSASAAADAVQLPRSDSALFLSPGKQKDDHA
jgi:hypothetical protein